MGGSPRADLELLPGRPAPLRSLQRLPRADRIVPPTQPRGSSTMKVGVIEHFDSMHLLPGHPKCGVPHGHTYKVEVTAEGPVVNGMVIDFDVLKRSLRELLKIFDHTDLNRLIPIPSCEHISQELLKR